MHTCVGPALKLNPKEHNQDAGSWGLLGSGSAKTAVVYLFVLLACQAVLSVCADKSPEQLYAALASIHYS